MYEALAEEISAGFPDATSLARITLRLVVAVLLGAVIGFNREREGKPAGLRTHVLVSMGSALFVISVGGVGASEESVTRVVQGIAAGIGFIGAGAILKHAAHEDVRGLTTAAGLWVTAAAGVAVGLGRLGLATLCVGLAWVVLGVMGRIDAVIERRRRVKSG